jgi:hypothetical protein
MQEISDQLQVTLTGHNTGLKDLGLGNEKRRKQMTEGELFCRADFRKIKGD